MKTLKTLAIVAGIILLILFFVKLLQKGVRTKIDVTGINPQNKTVQVRVFANDSVVNSFDVPYTLGKNVYGANDYRLEAAAVGSVLIFRVLDDQNREMAIKPMDLTKPAAFVIYSE